MITTIALIIGIGLLTYSLSILNSLIHIIWKNARHILYVWFALLLATEVAGGSALGVGIPHERLTGNLSFVIVGLIILLLLAYFSEYKPQKTVNRIIQFCIVFPIGEEILFRGIIQSMVSWIPGLNHTSMHLPLLGTYFSVVLISAFLFATNHLQYHGFKLTTTAIRQIIIAFIGGLFLGSLVVSTGSLLYPVIIHVTFNSAATLFFLSKRNEE